MTKGKLNYYWWLIRSRLCALFGAAIIFIVLYSPYLQSFKYLNAILILGIFFLFLGLADGFGFIQKVKVEDAITEHENRKKQSLFSKQPWEP